MRGAWAGGGWGAEVTVLPDGGEEPTPDLGRPLEAETGATEPVGGWAATQGTAGNSVLYNVTTNGAVIEDMHVYGQIRVNANDVTVRNCLVEDPADEFGAQGLIWRFSGTGGQVSHCTLIGTPGEDPSAAGVIGFDLIEYCHISNCGDGIKPDSSGLVQFNWIEKMKWGIHSDLPTHCDGLQMQDCDGAEIRYNVLLGPLVDGGSATSVGDMNSALNGGIFLKTDSGPCTDYNIHGNEVRGFATNMYLYQTNPRAHSGTVTDNIIGDGDEKLYAAFRNVGTVDVTYSGNVDQDENEVEPS